MASVSTDRGAAPMSSRVKWKSTPIGIAVPSGISSRLRSSSTSTTKGSAARADRAKDTSTTRIKTSFLLIETSLFFYGARECTPEIMMALLTEGAADEKRGSIRHQECTRSAWVPLWPTHDFADGVQ